MKCLPSMTVSLWHGLFRATLARFLLHGMDSSHSAGKFGVPSVGAWLTLTIDMEILFRVTMASFLLHGGGG